VSDVRTTKYRVKYIDDTWWVVVKQEHHDRTEYTIWEEGISTPINVYSPMYDKIVKVIRDI
jgi:hypothetical protein